jgi:hypothetical protein
MSARLKMWTTTARACGWSCRFRVLSSPLAGGKDKSMQERPVPERERDRTIKVLKSGRREQVVFPLDDSWTPLPIQRSKVRNGITVHRNVSKEEDSGLPREDILPVMFLMSRPPAAQIAYSHSCDVLVRQPHHVDYRRTKFLWANISRWTKPLVVPSCIASHTHPDLSRVEVLGRRSVHFQLTSPPTRRPRRSCRRRPRSLHLHRHHRRLRSSKNHPR